MRRLLLIGRWFRGRNKVVVDLQAYREQKEKRKEKESREYAGPRAKNPNDNA